MLSRRVLFDFKAADDSSSWEIINDGVMGGKSKGHLDFTEEGYGRFYGTVSLENLGGFTSIRCKLPLTEVGKFTSLVFRVKGSGPSFQIRVKHRHEDYHDYVASFATNGNWSNIHIPLTSFIPLWQGSRVNLPRFDRESICEFKFLIANRRNESFELLIDKIELIS